MNDIEIYERFHGMQGEPANRIKVLAHENSCTEREIKEALQKIQREGYKPEFKNYHPDENPFCRVNVELTPGVEKGDIPEYVLDLIFNRLDELEAEIKERETEYNNLVDYLGGKR